MNKKSYFQGGGGVNEPTPGKKKYKVDPAIVVQPRFKEPFYRNYDLYDTEGVNGIAQHGPGSGCNHMDQYKSIQEFLDFRRKKLQGKYVAEDSYIEDTPSNYKERVNKMKIRAAIINRIIKIADDENNGPNYDYGTGLYENMDKYDSVKDFIEHPPKGQKAFFAADSNNIDFPLDDQIDSIPMDGVPGPYGNSDQIGYTERYIADPDIDGKQESSLNFGRDLDDDEAPVARHHIDEDELFSGIDLDELMEKYLTPSETEIYGLPDGVDSEDKDADKTIESENPEFGITDSGRDMYEDKWNI